MVASGINTIRFAPIYRTKLAKPIAAIYTLQPAAGLRPRLQYSTPFRQRIQPHPRQK
jgi:hypothetical protein